MPEFVNENYDYNDIPEFDTFSKPKEKTCPAVGFQKVNVSVPVTVAPFAHAGHARVKCCGNPVVISCDKPCSGKKNETCSFTISQTICIEVPVEFGAKTKVGDTYVDCLNASAYDICKDCKCAEHMDEHTKEKDDDCDKEDNK